MERLPPTLHSIGIDLNRRAIDTFRCDDPVDLSRKARWSAVRVRFTATAEAKGPRYSPSRERAPRYLRMHGHSWSRAIGMCGKLLSSRSNIGRAARTPPLDRKSLRVEAGRGFLHHPPPWKPTGAPRHRGRPVPSPECLLRALRAFARRGTLNQTRTVYPGTNLGLRPTSTAPHSKIVSLDVGRGQDV